MTDFLLELLSEEIPARMQDKARDDLARLFAGELDKAGLKADAIVTYATPRRLTLIARGLPPETQAVAEELKGPKTSAPPQALDEAFAPPIGTRPGHSPTHPPRSQQETNSAMPACAESLLAPSMPPPPDTLTTSPRSPTPSTSATATDSLAA